jgi:predicted kinase
MAGLPGTGKSALASALAAKTSGVVLNKDQIRAALFPPAEIEYSAAQDDFCVQVALNTATYILYKHPEKFVFIDGRPFSRRGQIDVVVQAAEKLGQRWRILECVCREEVARERLEAQSAEHIAADRNYALYLKIKAAWEPITRPKTVIDTEQPIEQCAALALVELSR